MISVPPLLVAPCQVCLSMVPLELCEQLPQNPGRLNWMAMWKMVLTRRARP